MILKFDKDVGWPVFIMPLKSEKPGYVLGCPMAGPLRGQIVWVPREDLVDAPPQLLPPRLDCYRKAKTPQ